MKVYILRQLLKNIKSHKPNENVMHGDLYGLVNGENKYVFCCCLRVHQLKHDPTLLLPSSFAKLGSLICSSKEQSVTSLAADQLALVHSDGLTLYLGSSNSAACVSQHFDSFEEEDLLECFSIIKIAYSLPILCGNKTADVKSFISSCKDDLYSDRCRFKLKGANVIVFSDGCQPKEEASRTVGSLPRSHISGGSPVGGSSFELFFNKSVVNNPSAPALQIDSNKFRVIRSSLLGEAGIYLPKDTQLDTASRHFSKAVANQLQLAEYWILKQLHDSAYFSPVSTHLMKPIDIGNLFMPIYPSNVSDDNLEDYRKQIHQTFLLPLIRPLVKRIFATQQDSLNSVLINPHLKAAKSGVKGGEVSLVQGLYGYHHYMQDRIDDNKWGCAYRSLQTLISWFRMQGYTDKPIPTHAAIQQILVDIKDKPASFVGSRQWIGSTEVGFVLQTYLNVDSRFISVNSGADIADHGRDLHIHFQSAGTPIMIGGGVLAHTIIGVDWNCSTEDIKYLILDPHYTGADNLNQIVKQGWCGWKGQSFWNAKAYYNLCLPQRPISI